MPEDVVVGVSNRVLSTNPMSVKPPYLIVLGDGVGKTKTYEYFISLDRPEQLNGFLQAKGIFVTGDEQDIIKNFSALLTSTKRELILEMMFPWHRICSVRNLVFKAK